MQLKFGESSAVDRWNTTILELNRARIKGHFLLFVQSSPAKEREGAASSVVRSFHALSTRINYPRMADNVRDRSGHISNCLELFGLHLYLSLKGIILLISNWFP